MIKRLLVTGAGGGLGRYVRERLKGPAEILRLSDVADLSPAGPGEEVMRCDLADRTAVDELVRDCDMILHLGAISVASSNHVIGFHPVEERLDDTAARRPDSLYGVSKCFGEDLARLYFDKFGLETACLRIGSCFDEPKDRRMLSTWLSPGDFISLITKLIAAGGRTRMPISSAGSRRIRANPIARRSSGAKKNPPPAAITRAAVSRRWGYSANGENRTVGTEA